VSKPDDSVADFVQNRDILFDKPGLYEFVVNFANNRSRVFKIVAYDESVLDELHAQCSGFGKAPMQREQAKRILRSIVGNTGRCSGTAMDTRNINLRSHGAP